VEIRSLIPVLILLAAGMSPAWAGLQDTSGQFASERASSIDQSFNSQSTRGQAEFGGTLGAAVGPDALNRVSGNVGVNIAAGALKVQSNQGVIDTATQAESDTRQDVQTTVRTPGSETSMLAGAVLSGAGGGIGISIAPGGGNAQINLLVMH